MDVLLKELPQPELYGPKDADITIISWGSTSNIVKEAINILNSNGIKANQLHLMYINPFHSEEVLKILNKAKETLCVEQNFSGQMRDYIRMKTGFNIKNSLLRYDGEPIVTSQIVNEAKEVVQNE